MSPFDNNRSSSVLPQIPCRLHLEGSRVTGSTGNAPEVGTKPSEDQALLFLKSGSKLMVPAETERDASIEPQDVLFPPSSWKTSAVSPTVMPPPPAEQVGKHRHGSRGPTMRAGRDPGYILL